MCAHVCVVITLLCVYCVCVCVCVCVDIEATLNAVMEALTLLTEHINILYNLVQSLMDTS